MSGTVLSDFMKSTTSAEFTWIVLDANNEIVGVQVVPYVYLEGMTVQIFPCYSIIKDDFRISGMLFRLAEAFGFCSRALRTR